ncbi:unnamed protein product [Urochloa humidicola]
MLGFVASWISSPRRTASDIIAAAAPPAAPPHRRAPVRCGGGTGGCRWRGSGRRAGGSRRFPTDAISVASPPSQRRHPGPVGSTPACPVHIAAPPSLPSSHGGGSRLGRGWSLRMAAGPIRRHRAAELSPVRHLPERRDPPPPSTSAPAANRSAHYHGLLVSAHHLPHESITNLVSLLLLFHSLGAQARVEGKGLLLPLTLTVIAEHDWMRDRAIAYSEELRIPSRKPFSLLSS